MRVGSGLSSDCRRQLIWRESGYCLSSEKISRKRTDIRHAVSWFLLPHVRLFLGAVGDKFGFYGRATQHVIEHSLFTGLSRQRGYSTISYGQRSPDLNPIAKCVWMLWGGKFAGRNYPPTNKNTLIRALTEEWDKLPSTAAG
ncbi:hypothetical protein TNCV_1007101 [Trichonephila clavipes]|nr:hypothetical protein TNCV_1007101 [Trichonephila clavipes]